MPSIIDSSFDDLLVVERDISQQIVAALADLPFADPVERVRLLRAIRELLNQLREEIGSWAWGSYTDYAVERDNDMLLLLGAAVLAEAVQAQLVGEAVQRLMVAVGAAERAVDSLANRLSRPGGISSILGARARRRLQAGETSGLREALRSRLSSGYVEVLAGNARTYRYSLDYWLSLQSFMARQLMGRDLAIARATSFGVDLVQISDQPSTIGDFCDLYRGKIFSVSGTHEFYLPLSAVPNGGAPMHVWCRHTTSPYLGTDLDEDSRDIPANFIELGHDGADANAFQRLWIGGGSSGRRSQL